jgi:hypothetical protein
MERLCRGATCLVVGIGGGHRGAPWPVSLAYPGGRLLPLNLRAFIDFAAQRLRRSPTAPIAPVPWDKPRKAFRLPSDKDQIAERPPRSNHRVDRGRANGRLRRDPVTRPSQLELALLPLTCH